jgi:hypothetical protein
MERPMSMVASRRERLRALENVGPGGMEARLRAGTLLKEIRDGELYKEDGFATWEAYLRERWELPEREAQKRIEMAEIRARLPELPA